MDDSKSPLPLEILTIQPIPRDRRHGKAGDLFTVWFGTNLQLLTVITGAIAVSEFGLPLSWAVVSLTLGNLVGGIFMALHAAQGPQLGVPQMVQTRGQFGTLGSLLVITIVIVMYVGFLASNIVLGGEALASVTSAVSPVVGIVAVALISMIGAVFGHDLIHSYARVISVIAGAALALAAVWILVVHGVPPELLLRNSFTLRGFLGAFGIAALWQIAYAPYVSDYSRYMPHTSGVRGAFWATYWGCTVGTLLPMILGVIVALTMTTKEGVVAQLAALTRGVAPLVIGILTLGVAANSAMNLYCGALSTLTVGQTLFPSWTPGSRSRVVTSVVLTALSLIGAVLGSHSFLVNYTNFILLLLYVLVPWTAINLIDYYVIRRGEYNVEAFLRPDGGIYGRFNTAAVVSYLVGILVQVPFVSTPMYTGPIARVLGGADLSWMIGLAVTARLYTWLVRRSTAAETVAPAR